jgi:PKD repeat protein
MKKITFLLIVLISSVAFSQVTYISTDFASVNEQFIVSHSTTGLVGNDFVQTGANQIWDYSTLTPSSQETLSYINPNASGYKNIWCLLNSFLFNCTSQFNNNFNLASKLTNGLVIQGSGLTNVIDHLKVSATKLEDKMIGASITFNGATVPFAASYQTPDVVYQFPIAFNDNYTNTSALSLDLTNLNVPIQYASAGQRTNVVDGWGSLTTPFGTFANVLKMKSIFTNTVTVTANNGTPTTNVITTVSYKWFDKNYGIPVLQVDGTEANVQFIPTTITYFDIQRCLTPNALFGFFPVASDFNPTTNNASVSFINVSSNYDTLIWDFGDGSSSTSPNPTHNFSCPGVNQVTLTVNNSFCSQNQTDTISIPVTITDTQNAFTTGVTVTGTTLTADRTLAGTTYQWVDCNNNNTNINGQNSQTFAPTSSGSYAVQLTTNGCQSISTCYPIDFLKNETFTSENIIVLYPNPTTGLISIAKNQLGLIKNIEIYNVLGEFVSNKLDLSQQSEGMYFVKIMTAQGTEVQKIIKQ